MIGTAVCIETALTTLALQRITRSYAQVTSFLVRCLESPDRLGHRAGRGPDIVSCSEADEITVVPRSVGRFCPPIAESLADHAPRNSVYALV
jgi:hypothetical protein